MLQEFIEVSAELPSYDKSLYLHKLTERDIRGAYKWAEYRARAETEKDKTFKELIAKLPKESREMVKPFMLRHPSEFTETQEFDHLCQEPFWAIDPFILASLVYEARSWVSVEPKETSTHLATLRFEVWEMDALAPGLVRIARSGSRQVRRKFTCRDRNPNI